MGHPPTSLRGLNHKQQKVADLSRKGMYWRKAGGPRNQLRGVQPGTEPLRPGQGCLVRVLCPRAAVTEGWAPAAPGHRRPCQGRCGPGAASHCSFGRDPFCPCPVALLPLLSSQSQWVLLISPQHKGGPESKRLESSSTRIPAGLPPDARCLEGQPK